MRKRPYISEKTHSICVEATRASRRKTEGVALRLHFRIIVVTSSLLRRKPIVIATMTEVEFRRETTTVSATLENPNERAYVGM